MDKNFVNKVLTALDRTAEKITKIASMSNPEVSNTLMGVVNELDSYADKFQVAAYGKESFRAHQAKVICRNSDEPYMDTFENPNKLIESGTSGEYMKEFDTDNSSAVTNRDEHHIRDLSEFSGGTKKQPTWARGPVR